MAETAPAVAAPLAEATAKKQQKKAAGASKSKKPSGPSVSDLIVKGVGGCKERKGISLPALKKVLAAGSYDVPKNNSRIKLALKSLVSRGVLVQLKGSGASGSFKLNKPQAKDKAAKKPAAKSKKPAAKKPAGAAKKPKKAPAGVKKSPKKVKKPAAAKGPKKPKAAPAKKAAKSPAKAKAAKPKAAKRSPAKSVKPKAAKPKKAAPKKK